MNRDEIIEEFLGSLLKQVEAAERMGIHPFSLSRIKRYGGAPKHYQIGRGVFYRPEDIDAWIEQRKSRK